MDLKAQVKKVGDVVYNEFFLHWKRPAKGNYISYKELTSYALGGMGKHMLVTVFGYMAMSVTNLFFGSTIGIRPLHLQYMSIIITFINFFMSAVRGKLVDNTRTRWGKLRPYVALMSLPLAALSAVLIFLPLETFDYTQKLFWVFLFGTAIAISQPLFVDAYDQLPSVMTPNSGERAKVIMIATLISSLAPTIYLAIINLMMDSLEMTYVDFKVYRMVMVPLGFVGALLSLIAALGVKERIITPKTYSPKVGIFEGVLGVYRNKYWWIMTLAGTLGFLEGGFNNVFGWMYIYGLQNMTIYGVLYTLYGTASTIAMLITPILLKKLGNRKTLLLHNTMNIILITLMLFSIKNYVLYFILLYTNTIFNQLQLVYNPVLNAEIKDYQQYLTGKRVDFILGAAGQILIPVTILTGLVYPFLFESLGVTTNYDVLFDSAVRNRIFTMLCACSIAGAALNLIPFFFYRLSRQKHNTIILVLKERAAFNDHAAGEIAPEQIVEVVEKVREIERIKALPAPDVKGASKAKRAAFFAWIKAASADKAQRWAEFKVARKALAEAFDISEYQEAIKEIYDTEMTKFTRPLPALKLRVAAIVAAIDANDLAKADFDARTLDFTAATELERNAMISLLKKQHSMFVKMQEKIKHDFPNGVERDYLHDVHNALEMPEETKQERKLKKATFAAADKIFVKYTRTYYYWIKCREMVTEHDNSKNYAELEAMYEDAILQVKEKERLCLEKEEAERQMRADDLAEIKRQKFESYSPEKQQKILDKRAKREAKKAMRLAAAEKTEPAADKLAIEIAATEEDEDGGEE